MDRAPTKKIDDIVVFIHTQSASMTDAMKAEQDAVQSTSLRWLGLAMAAALFSGTVFMKRMRTLAA